MTFSFRCEEWVFRQVNTGQQSECYSCLEAVEAINYQMPVCSMPVLCAWCRLWSTTRELHYLVRMLVVSSPIIHANC